MVAQLLIPSDLLALTAIVSLLLLVFRFRIAFTAVAVSSAALALATLSPLGNLLLVPLEQRFEAIYPPQGLDGIIVLAGSYDYIPHPQQSTVVLEDDTEPVAETVRLAHRYPEAKVIVTGGSAFEHAVSVSSVMKDYLSSVGIAAERIVIEEHSRNTAQSARFTAGIVHPSPTSRWLLVTYGHQMPRAVGAFRKAGFNVSAFPVGLRTSGWKDMWTRDSIGTKNLARLDIAAHEWLGLFYYKAKGYSDAWLPGPNGRQPQTNPPNPVDAPVQAAANASPSTSSRKYSPTWLAVPEPFSSQGSTP